MHPGQLDLFMHALMWKAVPVLLVATIGAGLLGFLFKRLEHALIRWLQSRRRGQRNHSAQRDSSKSVGAADVQHCPSCNRTMVKRKARRGLHAGEPDWP